MNSIRDFLLQRFRIGVAGTCITLCAFADTGRAERFDTLDTWEPLTFDKIDAHSSYDLIMEGTNSVLRARSAASASGLVQTSSFDASKTPTLSWRWKIDDVIAKGNALTKDGDDYAMRVYVTFAYDPDTAGFGFKRRAQYGLAKKVTGEYPPHSALSYIWSNRAHDKTIIENAYSDRAMMVVRQSGKQNAGKWMTERVNILEDYKKAYGVAPPAQARLAIMADSDNTGGSSTAYIDDIRLEPAAE